MNTLSSNSGIQYQKAFYLPQNISQKLHDEDSNFYKSFRIKTPAKNIKSRLNLNATSSSALSFQKQFNYASYLIETHNKLSIDFSLIILLVFPCLFDIFYDFLNN